MTRTPQLKEDAAARRAQFETTWRSVQGRLTLPGLAEEALRMSKTKAAPMGTVAAAVRRYPLLATGLLAGVSWMLRRTMEGTGKSARRALQKHNPRKGDDA
jgi:hypothetical protein